eukprot:4959473-Lingulodinium_polyedra.AAC.1
MQFVRRAQSQRLERFGQLTHFLYRSCTDHARNDWGGRPGRPRNEVAEGPSHHGDEHERMT